MHTEQLKTRREWLEERREGIGASDVAAILGLSPWTTPLHVYRSKVDGIDEPETARMRLGTLLEPVLAQLYLDERPGHTLTSPGLTWHPTIGWLFCTPDRVRDGGVLVELKTSASGEGWGAAGTDEIPPHYLAQVQHQMCVMDADVCEVATLVAMDFRIYAVQRDDAIIEAMVDRLRMFWRCVESRTPPEPDFGHRATLDLLNRWYRPEGSTTALGPEALDVANTLEMARTDARSAEAGADYCKAKLTHLMGSASVGELPDGRIVERKVVKRKAHEVEATEYPTITVKTPKER